MELQTNGFAWFFALIFSGLLYPIRWIQMQFSRLLYQNWVRLEKNIINLLSALNGGVQREKRDYYNSFSGIHTHVIKMRPT